MAGFTSDFIVEALQREFDSEIVSTEIEYGMLNVYVAAKSCKKIIHHLKDSNLGFTFLTDICAVHYPDKKDEELCMVYHLHNLQENFRIRIKASLPENNPELASLCDLFAAANWMERETYDFFGIKFTGHPDLRIILNDPEMGYHPMLKQYKLEDGTRTDKDDSYFGR